MRHEFIQIAVVKLIFVDKDMVARMCRLSQTSSDLNGSGKHTLNGVFSLMILTENCSLSILKHSKLVGSGELTDRQPFC